MDERHLHILQHALGLDRHGRDSRGQLCPDETYRNRFVTGDCTDDAPLCQDDLVNTGPMVCHRPSDILGGSAGFSVTPAGRAYVREHSPGARP